MKKIAFAAAFTLTLAALQPAHADGGGKEATIYKDPQCGCCTAYGELMERAGYHVTIKPTDKVDALSRMAGIPDDYQGCHLTRIGGYFFSGHVPLNILEQVLAEKPPVKSYALPGMPMGSPGMGGQKEEPFQILSLDKGEPQLYAVE